MRSTASTGLEREKYLCLTEELGLLMSSLCKEINALLEGSGVGGEENARGTRAVDFKQGTWEDGEFATMNKGSPFQVGYFFSKYTPAGFLCVCTE
jgi:hypothetical protein